MRRSLLHDATSGAWLPQFGVFKFPAPNTIKVHSGLAVDRLFHAEAHHDRVLGADFTYSATITADWTQPHLSAHLQFRIADEGRYGVRLQAGTIALYRFMLQDRRCSDDPAIIAHCPLWPVPDSHHSERDDAPIEVLLGPPGYFDTALQTVRVTVVAEGSRFIVSFGTTTQDLDRREIEDIEHGIGIGRFGVYVVAATPQFDVRFDEITATTDPTATINFALLYSTTGYDLDGTKRALVRTVNDIDVQDYDDRSSTFTVTNALGEVKIRDRRFEASGAPGHTRRVARRFRRTFGFQFLAADFTDLREAGRYTLEARLATSGGIRVLSSRPFEIIPRLVTERMLWPLSILNAKARRAAEEDFRRNWFIESGHAAWSVGLDGVFVADRADDQRGAVLRRIFNTGNLPLSARDFRFVARITIVAGCDAQLQFRITDDERWAVTLQAGEAGGCQHGDGPGAVRLHREGRAVLNEHHFEAVASHRMDGIPFQVGRAYDVEVRALAEHIEVMLDGELVINFGEAVNPGPGAFALKAWGSTVRFGQVKVWARDVGLSRPVPGVWIPFDRGTNLSSQGFKITTPDFENNGVSPTNKDEIRFPLAAQQQGFHDCNSFIGEVTSHSVFLSTLMEVWATRAHDATLAQQEDLRCSILTAVLYLKELYEQGNRSGAFAHQEPGRTALGISHKVLTTQFAMYGLSSFAEKGGAVDKKLAREAFDLASMAWGWLYEIVDPATTSWVVGDVEHVAAASSQGDLLVFFFSPDRDWQFVNVSQKTGLKIVGAPTTSWVIGNVEHVAAGSPQGDLLVFFFSPGMDWLVVNVSQKTGQKIAGPPATSWVVGDVEHVAAASPQDDLLVFFFSPDRDWQFVNVSQKTGQKIVGPATTSWVVGDVEHVAAGSPQSNLLVFFFSRDKDWQVVNVCQKVGRYLGGREDVFLDSIVAIRMARAAQREGMPADGWFDRAKRNAAKVLTHFETPGAMANMMRPTLRSIPWFEGVYETFFRGPFELTEAQTAQVASIAGQLVALMNDTANGFRLIPQAHDSRTSPDAALPARNWNKLADLPLAVYPIPNLSDGPPPTHPVGDWYISNHFATAAADCVYIGRLAGQRTLERLATGNLYWILGLNPGIPTTKVVPPAPTDGPWSAASFVYNGPGAFARSFEGNRTRTNAAKGWLADWEESASSRHRESWAFDLARNGFQSIVNGHVLRESQWHYWSVGIAGWVCAETFMLTDAGFLKAALALEDWHSGSELVRATPYDVSKLHFFDTTHLDRANTPWEFDDPDRTPAALASRMATDFAASKGFGAGRLTGHHVGERVGVLCLPVPGTTFVDVMLSEIAALRFPFHDINAAPWAQVARAATEIAANRGVGAGCFTGHQLSGKCGWIGIDARLVEVFDIDDRTVAGSPWAFTDINTVGWAQAARLATDICVQFGFAGGFFTGHQLPNKRQIAALRHT